MTSPAPVTLDQVSAGLASVASAAPLPLQHFTLNNGLSVYLRPDHPSQLAAVQLWYHVGSSHEPAGHSNLSHLLEHLIFEGSSKLAAGQYSRVIARLGGNANASTHEEATAYEITLPVARLPIALEIMADAMNSATFGQAELDREKKAVEDERRLKLDNHPDQQAYDLHLALAHGGNAYGQPSFGSLADLADIGLETLRTWYATWYRPNNATLVVVGGIDLATLRTQVEQYFASLPSAPVPQRPVPRQDQPLQARTQTVSLPGLREGLFMSFNVPSRATAADAATAPALELIREVLAEGFSARLYSDLVRDKRLLTGISITYQPLLQGDTLLTLSAYVNSMNSTPEQAAHAVCQHLEALRNTAVPTAELERAKLRMLARRLFTDSQVAQAERIGEAAAAGIAVAAVDQDIQIIRDLDSQQVQQVALAYLGRERLTTSYLQPGATA
ncbi:M16 family metallopeptidase [Pseudomonas juntendi]|uniref:Insulinase family protein n=1 Tax=Pseudomonas juntendi TaxID=2666183 RepID=A0A7W2JKI8_9PSED|nr:pitrilysin family protein [Pseudomonas juntendi]MBA6060660.1 insulinase family protein [Pseudomonas juntendi]MBA6127641.1 insulinase family protein [Pseudomonas juntendi]